MSKANQKFVQADEAVSPVIGVILMVAITVVLAAVVFVLVSNLSKGGGNTAPNIALTTNDVLDRLEVASVGTGGDWSRLTFKVTSCSHVATAASVISIGTDATAPYQNEAAAAAGPDLNDAAGTPATDTTCGAGNDVAIAANPTPIAAGDYVEFCATNAATTTAPTNVIVTVVDTVANSQISTHTFATIALC